MTSSWIPALHLLRRGDIRFGKLTMSDADLQLIDADPRDPFDFFPAHYDVQLVAGYSKNTPAKGLKTYMPDYGDIRGNRPDAPSTRVYGSGVPRAFVPPAQKMPFAFQ
jgi:hypothetical protein